MSTEAPEVRGRSSGQGESRVGEALLALNHVLNLGESWDKAQGWGSGVLHMAGELGDSGVALRLSWAKRQSFPSSALASSFLGNQGC